jgi:hypothetical protein
LRTSHEQLRDKATYFASTDEAFDEETAEALRELVNEAVERYVDHQRREEMPANLLDFAVNLIYEVGRGDAFKEARNWARQR